MHMSRLERFIKSPVPHGTIGAACVVLALAQDLPLLLLLGAASILVCILTFAERA